MRFEDRLKIDCNVTADARRVRIPVMLLQTVVENAIKHGIGALPAGGVLKIRGELTGGVLVLEIENPRPALPLQQSREGIGLRNAAERLRLLVRRARQHRRRSVAAGPGHDPDSDSRGRMRALIVDDEPPARRELRRLLAEFPWIEIVGEAGNVDEAAGKVASLSPGLLFLDIQMPGGSGFDLLARLDYAPQVVFTTAHDEHAVRAFEVNALDYVLKPIDPERLAATVSRIKDAAAAPEPGAALEQIFVRDGPRCWFVPLREVRLLTSEGNYVRLAWGSRQPLLGRALASLEQRLDPKRFFRANRRQIINLEFIADVEIGVAGRLHVQLRDGPEVEISRRQARLFKMRTEI